MVRRRYISKGNTTFVDGLDKKHFAEHHSLFQRTPIVDRVLKGVLDQEIESLPSDSRKLKKKGGRRRAKPIDRTNITIEELEYQRLLNEIREAEEYELVIERDSSSQCRDDLFNGYGEDCGKVAQENEMTKVNFAEKIHSSHFSLKETENDNQLNIKRSSLVFTVHLSNPTTSTPVQANQIFSFDENEENERKSNEELKDGSHTVPPLSTNTTRILLANEKSSPQLTILNSPGHWGFRNEVNTSASEKFFAEHVCEDVTSSVQIYDLKISDDRSLSLCDGVGDNKPFYLHGFPWTAEYAKRRDYKQELFHLCFQKTVQPWRLKKVVLDLSSPIKLGEGTFGEVFRVNYKGEIVALKVIPIGGTKIVNGDRQKSFRDVTAELIVCKELSDLKQIEDGYSTGGFIHLRGAMVVKGSYPKSLVAAWEQYDKRMKSENDHPCIFNSSQHFLLLAFEDGGIDLEKYKIANVLQAYSIVYQVLMALSVAEYRLSFEHRDLHCGNILIRNVEPNTTIKSDYDGTEVNLYTYGIEVKIIDFTLSRMSKGASTIFFDLAKDDELFIGEGCLQYEIYRAMRMVNR
uniref:Protein kinase domain-containing protein n=1 Tax=Setaria digitata TaxID=48799 RepID=A0A915PX79_9BILA